ncbi:hypothetical protein [Hydrogenimonas sp.]
MTIQEKAAFLMETIPSEKEVLELKRRYLFGGLEAQLLLEASRTLHSPAPDSHLIEWAYDIIQLHMERSKNKGKEELPVQEKMERIIALFSNPEDLQAILDREEWSASDKRSIQLVSHFVANDIPLMSNFKIVDKVYRLLDNAYLPPHIAAKYFGKSGHAADRDRILEKYEAYRRKKERQQAGELPKMPEQSSLLKRYTYLLGAVATVAGIFLGGFFTAKFLYDRKAEGELTPAAMESILHKKGPRQKEAEENGTLSTQKALEQHLVVNRVLLEERLADYGVGEKVDFATRAMAEAVGRHLPSRAGKKPAPEEVLLPADRAKETPRLKGPLKVAVEGLSGLHGLKLPLAVTEQNLSMGTPVPEGFRLEADETPATRLLYLTDGETFYPVEIYAFTAEPVIVEYRLIAYKPGHHMPVVSNIWHFSDLGELRMHKHFVYQEDRIAPVKIIANHFLPGGGTIELVSVSKLDRRHRAHELPVARKDYLPTAKMLYQELYEIDRLAGEWRSRLVRQVWYDEGKKILAKGLEPAE